LSSFIINTMSVLIDMKKLAGLVRELEDQLSACTRCGMCQAVCPLYRETTQESSVARGKLAILAGLMDEAFKEPRRSLEQISRCLLCGACEANCPSGVRVLDILLKARAILVEYLGMPPAKRVMFRRFLAKPERFNLLLSWGARVQGLFIKPANELLGTSCARFTSPLADRHFKALAAVPFHRQPRKENPKARCSGIKAAFFYGCLIDKVYPEIGQAVLKSLDHFEVDVVLPEGQGCCGIPALSAGDRQTFNQLVVYNLDRLAGQPVDVLVTACPTCAVTIKKIWPVMSQDLDAEQKSRIESWAKKTVDITDFLVRQVGVKLEVLSETSGIKPGITYHDPCHLKKSLGVAASPRVLLQGDSRFRLEEMAEADACCGCGGSFTLDYYELSSAVGARKRAAILASGAEVVATACPACMLQLTDLLSKGGDPVRVRHVIELFAERLSG
jgi:glycolate oxidase iron-sulfur subunit